MAGSHFLHEVCWQTCCWTKEQKTWKRSLQWNKRCHYSQYLFSHLWLHFHSAQGIMLHSWLLTRLTKASIYAKHGRKKHCNTCTQVHLVYLVYFPCIGTYTQTYIPSCRNTYVYTHKHRHAHSPTSLPACMSNVNAMQRNVGQCVLGWVYICHVYVCVWRFIGP